MLWTITVVSGQLDLGGRHTKPRVIETGLIISAYVHPLPPLPFPTLRRREIYIAKCIAMVYVDQIPPSAQL